MTSSARVLDVERLALAFHRRINVDNQAINLDPEGYPGQPSKWERRAAQEIAAEYARLAEPPSTERETGREP